MESVWFQTLFNHNLGKDVPDSRQILVLFCFLTAFLYQPQHFWVDDSESENGCMCIYIYSIYIYVIYLDNSPITRKLHPTKCRDEEYLINSMTMVTNMVFIGETHIEFLGFIG